MHYTLGDVLLSAGNFEGGFGGIKDPGWDMVGLHDLGLSRYMEEQLRRTILGYGPGDIDIWPNNLILTSYYKSL